MDRDHPLMPHEPPEPARAEFSHEPWAPVAEFASASRRSRAPRRPTRPAGVAGAVAWIVVLLTANAAVAEPALREDEQGTTVDDHGGHEVGPAPIVPTTEVSAPPGSVRGLRSAPRVEPEDVLLALPRALLFLPRVALIAVFAPIRASLRTTQRAALIPRVRSALRWNEDETFGIRPIISFLSSDGVSGGATVFHDDLFGHDESLEVSGRFGGRYVQSYEVAFEGDRVGGGPVWVESLYRFESSPGLLFAGIGAGAIDCSHIEPAEPRHLTCPSYYAEDRFLAVTRVGPSFGRPGQRIKLGLGATVNDRTFARSQRGGRRSVEEVYDTARLVGFDADVFTLELDGSLVLDFMSSAGLNGTGLYFEAFGGGTAPVNRYRYVHYGGELATTFALFRQTRLLTLRAAVEGVGPGRGGDIPFTDLPRLGGPDRLRGYGYDRFRDRVAALSSVEYRYPIHAAVAGELYVDFGGVGRDAGALFSSSRSWNYGVGGGMVVGGDDDIALRLDVAYGEGVEVFVSTDLAHAFRDMRSEL